MLATSVGAGLHSRSAAPAPPPLAQCARPRACRLGTFFLTNVFFPVYMALRLRPDASQQAQQGQQGQQGRQGQRTADAPALPAYAPLIGGAAAAVGLFSLGWAAAARPELAGGLAERWDYFQTVMLGAQISRIDW